MRGFFVRRLVHMVITVFVVSLVVFFMVRLKGDPISVMAVSYTHLTLPTSERV